MAEAGGGCGGGDELPYVCHIPRNKGDVGITLHDVQILDGLQIVYCIGLNLINIWCTAVAYNK